MKCFFSFILSVNLLLVSLLTQAGSIVNIRITNDGGEGYSGLGVVVAKQYVLTSLNLVRAGKQIIVNDQDTGARLIASIKTFSEKDDLVLLKVTGLGMQPLILARQQSRPGRKISLLISGDRKIDGVLSRITAAANGAGKVLEYGMAFKSAQHGAPVVNNCGEIIGVSKSIPAGGFGGGLEPSSMVNQASSLGVIKKLLNTAAVNYRISTSACLSLAEQVKKKERELKKLQLESNHKIQLLKKKRERELKELNQKLDAQKKAEKKLKAARKQAIRKKNIAEKKARIAAARTKKEAEKVKIEKNKTAALKKKKEEELKARDEQQKVVLFAAGAAILVILLVSAVLLRKRKSKLKEKELQITQQSEKVDEMKQEIEASSVTFSDILFTGSDESGIEHRLKINGNSLVRSIGGQTIGRHAKNADHVFNVEQVSRLHLRLTVSDGKLYAEDLGSFNGTQLNGQAREKGVVFEIKDGDEVSIGTMVCRVHWV